MEPAARDPVPRLHRDAPRRRQAPARRPDRPGALPADRSRDRRQAARRRRPRRSGRPSADLAGPEIRTLTELSQAWRAHSPHRLLPVYLPPIGRTGRAYRDGKACEPAAATPGQTSTSGWPRGPRGRRYVSGPGPREVLDALAGVPLGVVVLHRVDQLAHEARREVDAGDDDAGDLLVLDLVVDAREGDRELVVRVADVREVRVDAPP